MEEVEAGEPCQTEDIEVAGTVRSEQGPRFEILSLPSLYFAVMASVATALRARPRARGRGSKRQDEDGRQSRDSPLYM